MHCPCTHAPCARRSAHRCVVCARVAWDGAVAQGSRGERTETRTSSSSIHGAFPSVMDREYEEGDDDDTTGADEACGTAEDMVKALREWGKALNAKVSTHGRARGCVECVERFEGMPTESKSLFVWCTAHAVSPSPQRWSRNSGWVSRTTKNKATAPPAPPLSSPVKSNPRIRIRSYHEDVDVRGGDDDSHTRSETMDADGSLLWFGLTIFPEDENGNGDGG